MSIPILDFTPHTFLDKTTTLYGESATGKSTIIVGILHELKPYADQIIVFSPTDRSNHTYSGNGPEDRIVPLPCIHYTISEKILDDIWARQEALVSVYRRASAPAVLRKLFMRVAADSERVVEFITAKRDERLQEVKDTIIDPVTAKRKWKEIEFDHQRFIEIIYKHYINDNKYRLARMPLDAEEKFALRYINLNPRLVLIFDDCTEALNKLKNNSVIQKIAYQGRHAMISTIVACHTDKSIDSAFRKNTFVSFFTEESCGRAYFNRASNDLDKESKAVAMAALRSTFVSTEPHQKLVWVREDRRFYRYTAKIHSGFSFGCPEVWNYCEHVGADVTSVSLSNRFIDGFII